MPHSCRCCAASLYAYLISTLWSVTRGHWVKNGFGLNGPARSRRAYKGSLCALLGNARSIRAHTCLMYNCWSSFRVRAFAWFIKSSRAHPAEQRNNFFPGLASTQPFLPFCTRRKLSLCDAAARGGCWTVAEMRLRLVDQKTPTPAAFLQKLEPCAINMFLITQIYSNYFVTKEVIYSHACENLFLYYTKICNNIIRSGLDQNLVLIKNKKHIFPKFRSLMCFIL